MPKYQAVSKSTHANLRWQRYGSYTFAAHDTVAPLVVQELPKACMTLPVALIQQDGKFTPVAVQGLQSGQNLFVAPDGRWIGPYTPAEYRGYPFALAKAKNEQLVLCVDADSGLVGEGYTERFFDEQGAPSPVVKDVLSFLQQVKQNRELTQRLCAVLDAEGLIQPWPISLNSESGEQPIEGLYRIDEAKFNSLDAQALYRVHQSGALPLVYCQLLSMQHLQGLGKLAQAHAQAKVQAAKASLPTTSNGELDLEFLNNNDTISFGV